MKPRSRSHKVKARLAVLGVTATKVCEEFNLDKSHFSYLVNNNSRKLQGKTVDRLAHMLGTDVGYLLDLDSWYGLTSESPSWIQR